MRVRLPDHDGTATRDGVEIYYEVYDNDGPTILLVPPWSIVDSRVWKMQIGYLARHFRVVAYDGRGNGRSSRPEGPDAYSDVEFAADAIDVLDASDTASAIVVTLSAGALWSLRMSAEHPERVDGVVFISPVATLAAGLPEREAIRFDEIIDGPVEWEKYNAGYWEKDYEDFLDYFFGRMFHNSHSTKQIEDCIGWGRGIPPARLAESHRGLQWCTRRQTLDLVDRTRCPVLVIHGSEDRIRGLAEGAALAEATGGTLVTLDSGGHGALAREPVKINRLIRDFATRVGRAQVPA